MRSFNEWLQIKEANAKLVMPVAQRTANFHLPGEAQPRGGNDNAPWLGGQPGKTVSQPAPADPKSPQAKVANFQRMLQQLGPQHPQVHAFLAHQKQTDPAAFQQLQAVMTQAAQSAGHQTAPAQNPAPPQSPGRRF